MFGRKSNQRLTPTLLGGIPEAVDNGSSSTAGRRWIAFAFWAFWVGVAFFGIYPATNWLASLRETHFALYVAAELELPFVSGFIWVYLSMYLLFLLPPFVLGPLALKRLGLELILGTVVSGAAFLIIPARLGFERVVPAAEPYASLYAGLFAIDQPFNLVPSLHIVYSAAISLAISRRAGAYSRTAIYGWFALIALSTILTHQHHLLDVATGLLLAIAVTILMGRKHA